MSDPGLEKVFVQALNDEEFEDTLRDWVVAKARKIANEMYNPLAVQRRRDEEKASPLKRLRG